MLENYFPILVFILIGIVFGFAPVITGVIADAVHIALDGVVQEAVQQHRGIVTDLDGLVGYVYAWVKGALDWE